MLNDLGDNIMIQYHTALWWEPCPPPLPIPASENRETPEDGEPAKDRRASQANPPPLPSVRPDDDYEWLLLL